MSLGVEGGNYLLHFVDTIIWYRYEAYELVEPLRYLSYLQAVGFLGYSDAACAHLFLGLFLLSRGENTASQNTSYHREGYAGYYLRFHMPRVSNRDKVPFSKKNDL